MKAGRNEKLLVPLPPTVVRYINVIGFVKSSPVGNCHDFGSFGNVCTSSFSSIPSVALHFSVFLFASV